MFRAKTVIVVGAGASVEAGLPSGPKLLSRIAEIVCFSFNIHRMEKGDPAAYEALKLIVQKRNPNLEIGAREYTKVLNDYILSSWQLERSSQQGISIDNIIDNLQNDMIETVGKIGIARAIIEAESRSAMAGFDSQRLEEQNFSSFSDTWYSLFSKALTEGVGRQNFKDVFENISFINFNYDRCIEHYLSYSLAHYYGLEPREVEKATEDLKMFRPYGKVGRLPWQLGDAAEISFGRATPPQLAAVSQQIKTFTEQLENQDELDSMRNLIASADRIIFLGFAFHRQNVELLSCRVQGHAEIIATAFGISSSDKAAISQELRNAFQAGAHQRIELANMTCFEFFSSYWRTITSNVTGVVKS